MLLKEKDARGRPSKNKAGADLISRNAAGREAGIDATDREARPMRGLMMDAPLQIISLLQFAARYHGDSEIVSRTVEGPIHRYTYADAYLRSAMPPR